MDRRQLEEVKRGVEPYLWDTFQDSSRWRKNQVDMRYGAPNRLGRLGVEDGGVEGLPAVLPKSFLSRPGRPIFEATGRHEPYPYS